ncbi:exodeoxyribonuclease VII small subunit [Sinanaerobacter chloroacetimidivorans]|uniref:Exodeoxyribonuclease VII small subunit n=1 Tax=Sinanaerobacter chloroacetimidivorans TaxID=2818044 RepID=A0A8J8AZW7_9FIRM|nr:exodeoxyribonuclease VII small subunit [Sinanaerobacter chloroacetimidivorans]MBR0596619.1 exodeoxyribonuclease VII small subunit [Sinanaerobacter chloroacetimidivorans]
MAKQNQKMSFEEALAGLEKAADILKRDDTTLEAAINSYEKGIEYYNYCFEILNEAKQKIEIYDKK